MHMLCLEFLDFWASVIIIAILDSRRRLPFLLAAGIEWSLDNDASNAAVWVASEAHSITLAVEGLLGVVFTVATLTDEAVDAGEVIVQYFPFVLSCSLLVFGLFFLGTTSLNPPDVSMILPQNVLGKQQFSALQWLIHCG